MGNGNRLALAAAVAGVLSPLACGATRLEDFWSDTPTMTSLRSAHLWGSPIVTRRRDQSLGDTMIILGAIIVIAAAGSDGGGSALAVIGGGALVGLGSTGASSDLGSPSKFSLGIWRGRPTASYTLARF